MFYIYLFLDEVVFKIQIVWTLLFLKLLETICLFENINT